MEKDLRFEFRIFFESEYPFAKFVSRVVTFENITSDAAEFTAAERFVVDTTKIKTVR